MQTAWQHVSGAVCLPWVAVGTQASIDTASSFMLLQGVLGSRQRWRGPRQALSTCRPGRLLPGGVAAAATSTCHPPAD